MHYEGLGVIDTTIVIVSVLLAVGVGIYFSKRQKSTTEYF